MVTDTVLDELYDLNMKPDRIEKHSLLSNVSAALYKGTSNIAPHSQIACVIDECVLNNILDFLTLRKQLQIQLLLGNSIVLLIDNLTYTSEEYELVSQHLQKLTDANVVLLDKKMKSLNTYEIFSGLETQNLYALVKQQKENRKDAGYTLDFLLKKGIGITAWQNTPANLLITFQHNNADAFKHKAAIVVMQGNYITTDLITSSNECLQTANRLFEAITRVPDSSFLELCSRILISNNNLHRRLAQIFSEAPLKTKQRIAHIIVSLIFPDKKREELLTLQEYIIIPLISQTNAYELLASANVCSHSELRRLFSSNAVRKISSTVQVLTPDYSDLQLGDIVRIGKRYLIKVGAA